MNKEQFKFSISNLINYYIVNAVQLNVDLAMAERDGRKEMIEGMVQNQAGALAQSFEQQLYQMIDELPFNEGEADE